MPLSFYPHDGAALEKGRGLANRQPTEYSVASCGTSSLIASAADHPAEGGRTLGYVPAHDTCLRYDFRVRTCARYVLALGL